MYIFAIIAINEIFPSKRRNAHDKKIKELVPSWNKYKCIFGIHVLQLLPSFKWDGAAA